MCTGNTTVLYVPVTRINKKEDVPDVCDVM